jgi:hypothetical protein
MRLTVELIDNEGRSEHKIEVTMQVRGAALERFGRIAQIIFNQPPLMHMTPVNTKEEE